MLHDKNCVRVTLKNQLFCCATAELRALRVRYASLEEAAQRAIKTLDAVSSIVVIDDGGVARQSARMVADSLKSALPSAA